MILPTGLRDIYNYIRCIKNTKKYFHRDNIIEINLKFKNIHPADFLIKDPGKLGKIRYGKMIVISKRISMPKLRSATIALQF